MIVSTFCFCMGGDGKSCISKEMESLSHRRDCVRSILHFYQIGFTIKR